MHLLLDGIYGFSGEAAFLSNFYESEGCFVDGIPVPTNEHRYQALKTNDPLERKKVLFYKENVFNSAGMCKRLGKTITLRDNWESIKESIMLDGLREKFSNPILAEKLRLTGDLYIEETNSWNDTYWGVSTKTGKGKNVLGLLLMKVRKEIS